MLHELDQEVSESHLKREQNIKIYLLSPVKREVEFLTHVHLQS